ncbi:hypothetical protein ACIRP0_35855 [Streptomyces sp. NPDC101733]
MAHALRFLDPAVTGAVQAVEPVPGLRVYEPLREFRTEGDNITHP